MEVQEKEQEVKVVNKAESEKIDLIRLIQALVKRIWLVILAGIIGGVLAYGWADYSTVPKYQASAMLYANNAISVGNASTEFASKISLGTAKDLIASYVVILNSRETLNDVIDYAGLNYSYGQLKSMISASAVGETEIFQVTVTSTSPEEAEVIANAIVEIWPKRISMIIEGTSIKVVERAVVPTYSISAGAASGATKGVLIGLVLSAGLIILLELLDTTIRSVVDIEQICRYPVLTMIPDMGASSGGGHYYHTSGKKKKDKKKDKKKSAFAQDKGKVLFGDDIHFEAAEGYKMLRTKIQFSFVDENDSHVIGVTSALAGEGKSVTSINLAHSLAQLEKKVILIDCDLRRPTIAPRLDLKREPGLSNYLTRQVNIGDILQRCKLGEGGGMNVIVAGKTPPNPVELLSSARMERTLEALRAHYDYIILDLPPIDEVGDAMAISKLADGMLLVVRQDYCHRNVLGNAIHEFEFAGTNILGLVLNYSHDNGYGKTYGRYKKYYRKYRYRYEEASESDDEKKGDN